MNFLVDSKIARGCHYTFIIKLIGNDRLEEQLYYHFSYYKLSDCNWLRMIVLYLYKLEACKLASMAHLKNTR